MEVLNQKCFINIFNFPKSVPFNVTQKFKIMGYDVLKPS